MTKDEKCVSCNRPMDEQYKKTGIFREPKNLEELPQIIEVGKKCGYCIVPYGSMLRDIDLLAVPWIETAVNQEELIKAICSINPHKLFKEPHQEMTEKPFGRVSQVISIAGANTYIDLTICAKLSAKSELVELDYQAVKGELYKAFTGQFEYDKDPSKCGSGAYLICKKFGHRPLPSVEATKTVLTTNTA